MEPSSGRLEMKKLVQQYFLNGWRDSLESYLEIALPKTALATANMLAIGERE